MVAKLEKEHFPPIPFLSIENQFDSPEKQ